MGRGLPNSPSAQTQQPFSCSFSHRPWSSLRKAFARNTGWLEFVSGMEKCLYVVGDDRGVAILDILFGYADVVIGNVPFPLFSQSQFLSL